MSKFFKETQKSNELALKQMEEQELDLEQIVQAVKSGPMPSSSSVSSPPPEPEIVTVPPGPERHRVNLDHGNGSGAHLILQQNAGARAALESYRGLRTRLMRLQAKVGLRVMTISSSQGGEGKTLTTMNLGLCFAQLTDMRILLIDTDLRSRGLTKLLNLPEVPGLSAVLEGEAPHDETIIETTQENLFVLPAGSSSTPPPELFAGPRWEEVLGWCREKFKIILVDTPPILPLADFELINAACDGVLMVVRARQTRRDVLQNAMARLDSKKLLGVVFNATTINEKNSYGYGYEYASR